LDGHCLQSSSPQIDATVFINKELNIKAKERTVQLWLRKLGYNFDTTGKLEIYNDGHQRKDVQTYLQDKYIPAMHTIYRKTTKYAGKNMDIEIPPCLQPGEKELL